VENTFAEHAKSVSEEYQCYMQPASVNDVKKRNMNGLTDGEKKKRKTLKIYLVRL
jgi:hypothetical protein